jgi:hypothetical protein
MIWDVACYKKIRKEKRYLGFAEQDLILVNEII